MLLRFLLLATTVLLVKTKVKANEDSQKQKAVQPGPPPPSFVAVVPTSIMGDFDGALFPFLIEETTTTTTTTTPAPFGTFFTILPKPLIFVIYISYEKGPLAFTLETQCFYSNDSEPKVVLKKALTM